MQFLSKQIANLSEFRLELLHTAWRWCNNCSNLNSNELVNKDHWYVKSNEPVSLCYLSCVHVVFIYRLTVKQEATSCHM